MDPPPYSLEDELLEVPDHPEDELLEVPDYPEDELQKVPDYPEDELPEVPYSLEDPLKEVSILVNNLYALSDAFCRQLLSQPLCSEDKRHIIRDCLTAFSTLENKLVASVPGYYLENPLNDSLRDLVGCIVSFCDFKRLEEIWARGKAKVSRNVADDHDIYSRFATRLREMKKLRDESKKRLHLAKTIKPLKHGGRLRIFHDDQLYLFVRELEITGILSTNGSIFQHIYPSDCEMVTPKISQLSYEVHCMLQKSCCLKKLPSGYWNIHKDLRDATTNPDLWENSCLGKLALGESLKEKSRLLLVTGEAGCGKTNLLLHIAKLLLKRKWYDHSDPHQVVTHFSEDRNAIQDCLSSLQEQFEGNNDGGSRDTSFDDLGKTLRKFSEANTNTTTYVILDGLDKYDNEDLTRLFELISTTINSSPKIHWILSIRSFENSTAIKGISYTLANVGDNKKLKDVAYKFVSMQVDTFFKRTGCRDTSRNYFKYKLSEGWRGNLLWITLACCTIEKHPKGALHLSHLEEKDERLKIESLYAYIYIQLHLTTEEKKYFGEIVTTLTAAYRPLTICELRLLVPPIDAVDLEDMIKRRLLFFLEVQDGLVCFGHELAKKYLVKKYAVRTGPEIQRKIALRCFENFASSSSSSSLFDGLSTYYAVSNWIKDFLISQSTSGNLYTRSTGLGAITDVLSRGFTRWLDVMKKIRYPVSEVNKDLLRLRDFLIGRNKTLLIQAKEDIPHDCIIADIIDALRFLRFNHDLGDARPMDSLLFYPYEEFKLKLLKGFFPQLLNKPATEYKRKDMTLNLHSQSGVLACAYSPDGHFLASTSKCDKSVSIWDVYTGRKISQLKTQALDGFNLSCIAFSVSGALAVLTSLNTIDVWDFPTRKIIKTIRKVLASPSNEDADFWNLTFSPDGKQLATTNGKSMLTWALPSFEEHRHQINTPDTISRVKFLGDGLIAFSSSNIITLWREETEENVHIFRGHKERITNLEFLPKHQWLASASRNESVIRLWDPNSGLELYTLDSHNSGIGSISFSFDETKLASGSKDAIEIWDLENIGSDPQGPNVRRIENFKDSKHVELVVFSPKDLSLASALRGGPTWIWDTCAFRHEVKGSVTQTVKHTSAIQCLKFSHNGEFFATADRDGKICIWDGKTGDYTISLESKGCKLHSISPDDQSLVTSSADGAMAIWNTGNWLLRRKLVGHRDKVLCVEFSPDGKHMASASHDGTIGIWDLLNEYEFAAMKPAHQIKVELELETLDKSRNIFQRGNAIRACMAFSPDGTQLACSVRGGAAVQIWKVKPDGSLDAPQQLHFATDASAKRIFFSQDANFIIASGYEHLGIWGIESKKRLIWIKCVSAIFQSLRWDARDPKYIFTELGRFCICSKFDMKAEVSKRIQYNEHDWRNIAEMPSGPQSESCALNWRERDIRWKGNTLVKFPSSYFPSCWDDIRMIWIHRKRIAMGYKSGHVMLLNFEGR